MSERFNIKSNKNGSKNTRLPVAKDFANYRFNRDELAHLSRYLMVCEYLISWAKEMKKPLRVLDIGCGDIYIARTLQASFVVKKSTVLRQYTGFDIDDISLARTAESMPGSFPIDLVCGDITTGGLSQFADGYFDVVICLETIEHIKPKFVPLLLSEIKRIGKRAIISTPNFDGGTGKIPEDHVKEWGYHELRAAFETAGLRIQFETGVFSNLGKVKMAIKGTDKEKLYDYFEPRFDGNLLSLVMARIVKPEQSQNILRVCV